VGKSAEPADGPDAPFGVQLRGLFFLGILGVG
jgi:hypothetical protein